MLHARQPVEKNASVWKQVRWAIIKCWTTNVEIQIVDMKIV
jgi:hypothetical protein